MADPVVKVAQWNPDDEPEVDRVWRWRYTQAREHGLTMVEARLFATGDGDLSTLRSLLEHGCPPRVAARIVT